MRVITGSAKGITLVAPKGKEIARPTTDRVKEGIFSAIQFDIAGKNVLDLFAGSGQLGIEALSRGAKSCTFVDNNPESLRCIRANLQKTNLREQAKVVTAEVVSYVKHSVDTFDFIFLDPPYMSEAYTPVLGELHRLLAPGGKIFCESPREQAFDKVHNQLQIERQYRYGTIMVTLLMHREETI